MFVPGQVRADVVDGETLKGKPVRYVAQNLITAPGVVVSVGEIYFLVYPQSLFYVLKAQFRLLIDTRQKLDRL